MEFFLRPYGPQNRLYRDSHTDEPYLGIFNSVQETPCKGGVCLGPLDGPPGLGWARV